MRVETLSSHHRIADFECGNELCDVTVRNLHQRVLQQDPRHFHAVVVADDDHNVHGIIALQDIIVEDYERTGREVGGPCLFYIVLAANRQYRNAAVVKRLLREVDETREREFDLRDDLQGEVACPEGGPPSLYSLLDRLGFSPLQHDQSMWYRLPPWIL